MHTFNLVELNLIRYLFNVIYENKNIVIFYDK